MQVRSPAVAGMFYYQDKEVLAEQLKQFFGIASPPPELKSKKKGYPIVISPHAGYEYSGQTAAFAIGSLKPAETFIILGPNHHGIGSEFSVSPDVWETPLGRIDTDKKVADELIGKCDFLERDTTAHINEHSIEVQLPFLQYKIKKFKFIPICINQGISADFSDKCKKLGETIAETIQGKKTGIIASSDFSHYLPLKIAEDKDKKVFETIKKLDVEKFFETLGIIDASVCGFGPIAVVMAAAKKLGLMAEVINKSSSGDSTGDFSSVVSYWAIGFKSSVP